MEVIQSKNASISVTLVYFAMESMEETTLIEEKSTLGLWEAYVEENIHIGDKVELVWWHMGRWIRSSYGVVKEIVTSTNMREGSGRYILLEDDPALVQASYNFVNLSELHRVLIYKEFPKKAFKIRK